MILLTSNADKIDGFERMSELVNKFGAPLIITTVAIIFTILFLNRLMDISFTKMKNNIKLDSDARNNENELLRQERIANIEQSKISFNIVSSIQTTQIETLKEIVETNKQIRDDIRNGMNTMCETNQESSCNVHNVIENTKLLQSEFVTIKSDILDIKKEILVIEQKISEAVDKFGN